MATGADLIAAAGYKILGNTALSATTYPSIDGVVQWLNDGQLEIARLADINNISELELYWTPASDISKQDVDAPADFLRLHSAIDTVNNKDLQIIDIDMWRDLISNTNSIYEDYLCSVGNNLGTFKIFYTPTSDPADKTFAYTKMPTTITTGGAETFSLKDDWISVVTDYAVAQAKLMEEEYQVYNMMMQQWYAKLGVRKKRIKGAGSWQNQR